MTQLEALKELAEKVEAGGNVMFGEFASLGFDAGRKQLHAASLAADACRGSLDAARALHKAVLGDRWVWQAQDYGSPYAYVTNRERPEGDRVRGATSTTPARAWLLAIIKAKIQELEQ